MADDSTREGIIAQFFLDTCQLRRWVNEDDVGAWQSCAGVGGGVENDSIPLTTGSAVELYIEPMLLCVGDVDVMCHRSYELAIPEGYPPPSQLPGEFHSRVEVYEIVNSGFPGYVYLVLSYLLTECIDDGTYNAVQCERFIAVSDDPVAGDVWHGPAIVRQRSVLSLTFQRLDSDASLAESLRSTDLVYCMRSLLWPPQAADWSTRQRNYGWPDSATVDCVVSNGCDIVGKPHSVCREVERISKCQWRLSFSRAEIALLNSWMPVQQIVYHMLRVFMKTTQLTDGANNSGACALSNYHIKTLMLWSCEMKSRSWWIEDLNLVRICVELLHTLAGWLNDGRCQHYFINSCNLIDQFVDLCCTQVTELLGVNNKHIVLRVVC